MIHRGIVSFLTILLFSVAGTVVAITFQGVVLDGIMTATDAQAQFSEITVTRNISNPSSISCTGTNGEFCPLQDFFAAHTITRASFFCDDGDTGESIDFELYLCTVDSNCSAPTLSTQGLNGGTLWTANNGRQTDITLQNDSTPISGQSLWIHIDKSTEITTGVLNVCTFSYSYT